MAKSTKKQAATACQSYEAFATEDTVVGCGVLLANDREAERATALPCPLCLGTLVIDDAIAGRAESDAIRKGGEWVAAIHAVPADLTAFFCTECGVAFYGREAA